MRAFDIGIGLAVAWARQRGVAFDEECPVMVFEDRAYVTLWYTDREGQFVDRGPVVEPVPLLDARVAFGIAMGPRGPWLLSTMSWSREPGHAIWFTAGVAYIEHDSRAYARVMTRLSDAIIDLDPRRWL